MKTQATRVLIYDKTIHTVLAVHPTGRKFKDKEGNEATGVWNIPGGEIDEGETAEESAIRETKEECDIDIKKSDLISLGKYQYNDYKDLHFFLCNMHDLDLSKCKCESYFENEQGKMLPEVNSYRLMNLEADMNMFFPVLQKTLKKVIKDYPRLFNK